MGRKSKYSAVKLMIIHEAETLLESPEHLRVFTIRYICIRTWNLIYSVSRWAWNPFQNNTYSRNTKSLVTEEPQKSDESLKEFIHQADEEAVPAGGDCGSAIDLSSRSESGKQMNEGERQLLTNSWKSFVNADEQSSSAWRLNLTHYNYNQVYGCGIGTAAAIRCYRVMRKINQNQNSLN